MSETVKYVDDEHKTIFLKLLNEQRLEGEHCDIAVVVEDVKFRAHRCVLAACSNYFKKLFKKHEVDSSSVIEIDFIRSDIFEEVLNYMYTAKISVKKKDVNLMMSSGQILGIRFLDKLCSQKRDMSPDEKSNDPRNAKFPYDMVKMTEDPPLSQDGDVQVLGDQDDAPSDDIVEEAQGNHDLDKSPNNALRVQEAILKELAQEEVHKVSCYDQEVEAIDAEPKELAAHAQTLSFADSMGDVKDEQPPGWTTATRITDLGMSPHLTAMLVGGGQLLGRGSSTGDTGFSYTQDSATDVMLLDSYTSEPSYSAHCAANKRRSSVTFEDQVDQIHKGDPSVEQVTADIHNSLDSFASSLAMAIENDAKLQLFGEWTQIPTSLFMVRNTQRAPRYLDGQRLRMESIDEGIVKDDDDEEEEHEEKIGDSSM